MLHTNTLRGLYQSGQPQSHETSLRAILATISLEDNTESVYDRKHFDERGLLRLFFLRWAITLVLHPSTGSITIMDSTISKFHIKCRQYAHRTCVVTRWKNTSGLLGWTTNGLRSRRNIHSHTALE